MYFVSLVNAVSDSHNRLQKNRSYEVRTVYYKAQESSEKFKKR